MNPMVPKWKKKWLAALRGGLYLQGRNVLRDRSGHYCCLGVLCDVVDPNGWSNDDQRTGTGDLLIPGAPNHSGSMVTLNKAMQEKTGVDDDAVEKLISMNDGGEDFRTIADWIEENL